MSTYPGGKNGSGVYQKIINQIPPHEVYIEPFLGGGAIMRLKKPALCSIGIDSDVEVIKGWEDQGYGSIAMIGDAISFLTKWKPDHPGDRVFVYLDPPYPGDTRKSSRNIYRHEFKTWDEHYELLGLIKTLPYMVAISSYDNSPYNQSLIPGGRPGPWRKIQFTAGTRSGPATETLWMNYPEPYELHDYRYLGENYREREVIAKRKRRWVARLKRMTPLERFAMLDAMEQYQRDQWEHLLPKGAQ